MKTGEEEICSVCLEPKVKPINLPCGHSFCASCVDGWRDKYGLTDEEKKFGTAFDINVKQRTCPNCRSPIPPTRNMLSTLCAFTTQIRELEQVGDFSSNEYLLLESKIKSFKGQIGDDWDGVTILEDHDDNPLELPDYIGKCVAQNNAARMIRWFGDPKSPEFNRRLDAQIFSCGNMALLHICGEENNTNMASILLQLGADVDIKDSQAATFLVRTLAYGQGDFESCGKLALEWGAATTGHPIDVIKILAGWESPDGMFQATLLKSEFGGRRCEIVGHARSDLNGRTCVADVHLPETDEYEVRLEHTPEELVIGHKNLKRRDRTPQDPGYYVEFKDGKVTRREFKSNEECQAFVAKVAETNWVVEEAAGCDEAAEAEAAEAQAVRAQAYPAKAVPVEAAAGQPHADQTEAESSEICPRAVEPRSPINKRKRGE